MSKDCWTSRQDFEDDLFAISDFCDVPFQPPKERLSSHTRQARSKPSIYDDLPEEIEHERPIRLGRGKVIARSNFRKPGGIPSFAKIESEIAKDIREAGGIGFSNSLIENSLRSKTNESLESNYKVEMPDITLKSPASSSASSSPIFHTSSDESPVPSPQLKREIAVTNGTVNLPSVYKPLVNKTKNLPPLYDMLKGTHRNKHVGPKMDTSKSFNIESNEDFPALN